MLILSVTIKNFGSIKSLDLDLTENALSIITGPTGSGKSTILDAISWGLFGETSKDVPADAVISWGQEEAQVTTSVQLSSKTVMVTRKRGKINDLYWEIGGVRTRGKDLTETQLLLNRELGVDYELFTTAAYYHQFSKAEQFFLSKAKERREVLGRIVNFDLADAISTAAAERRKVLRNDAKSLERLVSASEGHLFGAKQAYEDAKEKQKIWQKERRAWLVELEQQKSKFLQEKEVELVKITNIVQDLDSLYDYSWSQGEEAAALKAQISFLRQALSSSYTCPACGEAHKCRKKEDVEVTLSELTAKYEQATRKDKTQAKLAEDLDKAHTRYSRLEALQFPLEAEIKSLSLPDDPFLNLVTSSKAKITQLQVELNANQVQLEQNKIETSNVTKIYELTMDFRGALLENTTKEVEADTNSCLERFFDAPMRVKFTPQQDKIEVSIFKDGNECSFRQLSGGQRCLLKLCFGVAVMSAAENRAGVHFSNLFFDEALNGLDPQLKIKAKALFDHLSASHAHIFVIEHDESFQNLFDHRISTENS